MSYSLSTPNVTRWCMLGVFLVCLVAAICSGATLVKAGYSGTAYYYPDIAVPAVERVTRTEEPDKFQKAMVQTAFPVVLSGSVAVAAFYFFRRLGS